MAPGRASYLTHQIATLSSSTRIIGAPVSHVRSTHYSVKWRTLWTYRTRQRVVNEFLTAEGSSPMEIHRRLWIVYGEDVIEASSIICWVRRFKNGEKTGPTGGRRATFRTYCSIRTPSWRAKRLISHWNIQSFGTLNCTTPNTLHPNAFSTRGNHYRETPPPPPVVCVCSCELRTTYTHTHTSARVGYLHNTLPRLHISMRSISI